jgi:hypothetical protein
LPDLPPDSKEFMQAYKDALRGVPHIPRKAYETRSIKMARSARKRAMKRARKKGMEATITERHVVAMLEKQKFKCAITGIRFDDNIPSGSKRRPFGASLDRIDPSRGYTVDNVRVVCAIVNLALSDFGEEAFYKMCRAARTKRDVNLTTS